MKKIDAIRKLSVYTLKERFAYQTHDLKKVFGKMGAPLQTHYQG